MRFFIFFFALLLFVTPLFCLGNHISIATEEKGKVISYYDEYYVVRVNGTAVIKNHYDETMYSIKIPFSIDTLSIFEQGSNYINNNAIEFLTLTPGQEVTIDYQIRGITAINPQENNMSVLRSGLSKNIEYQALIISKLDKSEIEYTEVNTSAIRSKAGRRVVSIILDNPGQSEYNITGLKVTKTHTMDANDEVARWSFPKEGGIILLGPRATIQEDIVDHNAVDGEVYWLSFDIANEFKFVRNDTHSIFNFNQDDLLNPENQTVEELEELGNFSDYLDFMLYAKKTISKTQVMPNDVIDIDLRVNNFAPISRNITVTDTIPYGFELITNDSKMKRDGNELSWTKNVNPDGSMRIFYSLKYVDEELLGIDYFEPAEIRYDNNTAYTKRIPFVRKYIPEKKIFIQKKIRTSINDEFVVDIAVRNMGESSISNIYIKEFLEAQDTFREITKSPKEKGLWVIPELKSNEVWEVSYVTNHNEVLTALPEVFGVAKNAMLKTLVFENIVRNEWITGTINILEKLGISVLIMAPLSFFFLRWWKRNSKSMELKKMGKEIHRLKLDTIPERSDSIDFLMKESRKGINLPDNKVDFSKYGGSTPGQAAQHQSQGQSAPAKSDSENRKDAHDNLDSLKKLHQELEQAKK